MSRGLGVALVVVAAGVAPAGAGEGASPKAERPREFTLGVVQKGLQAGMSQADVAERLGSPNIVTRDASGREAWVYDKVSSEVELSSGGFSLGGLGSGGGGHFGGVLGISAGKRSEKARSSQQTLTVVVRFSATGSVETFSWHNSRF